MKAKIFTLLTLMVMTCMSLTSMAQEPVFILVEEDGNQITQPSQDSSFSFSQEETTTTTTTTEPSSFILKPQILFDNLATIYKVFLYILLQVFQ